MTPAKTFDDLLLRSSRHLNENPRILISLPKNDIELARGAIRGGVDGIKIHLNAFHRASGNSFGSFQEERPFLEELSQLEIPKAVMVGQETLPSSFEMRELARMGFSAFNCYLGHARPELFGQGLKPILALGHGFRDHDLRQIMEVEGAWIEASIVDGLDYGKPLLASDCAIYKRIVETSSRSVIVPSQKKILASDLPALRETGVAALLLGVIVTGDTAGSIEASIREFSGVR